METPCKNSLLKCGLTFVVLAALVACDPVPGPTYLLRATFENDALDGHPDKTLPGNPIGDELTYASAAYLSIIPTSYAPTYKSLDYRGGPSSRDAISFVGKSSTFVGPITFKWAGTVVNHWGGAPQILGLESIQISDGYGHLLVKLSIFGAMLIVKHKDTDPNNPTAGQLLCDCIAGAWEPLQHIIELSVNVTTGLFNVKLVRNGSVETWADIPLYEQNTSVYATSPRPTIAFYSGPGAADGDGYILDEVFISKPLYLQPL